MCVMAITLVHTCANCGLRAVEVVADHGVMPAGWRVVSLRNPVGREEHARRWWSVFWCRDCFNHSGHSVFVI